MKILSVDCDYATLDSGVKTTNELLWNYRSACCHYPLDVKDNAAYCSLCDKLAQNVVHKSAVVTADIASVEAIDALPDDVRVVAMSGYRISMNRPYSYVIVHDVCNRDLYDLPDVLRR